MVDCETFGMTDTVLEVADDAQLPALMAALRVGFHETVYFVLHLLLTDNGPLVLNEDVSVFKDHIGVWTVLFAYVRFDFKRDWLSELEVYVSQPQEMLQLR